MAVGEALPAEVATHAVEELELEPIKADPALARNCRHARDHLRVVRGDRGIDYGTMMAVVGTINRAGFTKVALLTEGPPAPASGTRATAAASP